MCQVFSRRKHLLLHLPDRSTSILSYGSFCHCMKGGWGLLKQRVQHLFVA